MKPRKTWCGLIISCLASVAAIFLMATAGAAAELPNVILLMGDDHGWDETGYNGHPHLKTPALDQMAASGLRLDNFYSAHPSCSPTRGSVITGRHPNRYGTFAPNYSIRPDETGIAQILGDAGYTSAHFGKWHLGPVKSDSPTNPGAFGFDTWLSHDNFFELDPEFSLNGQPPEKFEGESSEILIDQTIRFIKKANATKKPYFIVVWFGSPHEPYAGTPEDLKLYQHLRNLYPDQTVRLTSIETGKGTTRPLGPVLQERYAEITAMDRSIGQLRNWLRDQNQHQNTLLWYCGDNGTPSGGIVTSPFRGQKGNMYEGGIRVPGLIEWPARIAEPMNSQVNTVTSDILPTLCALTDQPLPKRPLDGINLVPLLDGEMSRRDAPIFFWSFGNTRHDGSKPYIAPQLQEGTTPLVKMMAGKYTRTFRNFHHPEITAADYAGSRVMLDNQYKLIVSNKSTQLFDLSTDPAEKTNLAESSAAVTKRMQRDLRSWQDSVLESLTGADY